MVDGGRSVTEPSFHPCKFLWQSFTEVETCMLHHKKLITFLPSRVTGAKFCSLILG